MRKNGKRLLGRYLRFSKFVLEHITTVLQKRAILLVQFSLSRIYSFARLVFLSEALGRLGMDAVHLAGGCVLRAPVRVFRQIAIVVILGLLLRLLGLEWISCAASSCRAVGIRLCLGEVKLDVTRLHYWVSIG